MERTHLRARSRSKWTGLVGTQRARACVWVFESWAVARIRARIYIHVYIYMGGYVDPFIRRCYIKTTANTACSFPERRTKMLIRLTGSRSPRPRARVAYEQSATLHPFDDAPKSCVAAAAEEATGDAHTAGTRWWRAPVAAMGMAHRALLRTSERNARATTTAVVAVAASTVDTGAAARFACLERRAPHTNTVGHPLARIIYTSIPVTGVQRAIVSRYTTHPHTHAITQHTQCGARAQRKR